MIHIIGDIIQSVGVIIAALIIYYFPEYKILDPITTILFSIIVIFTTLPIIKQCLNIIMEAKPVDININVLKKDIADTKGIISIICLHVYSLSLDKLMLNAKIVSYDSHVLDELNSRLSKYGFYHTNIEIIRNELNYDGCSNINDI